MTSVSTWFFEQPRLTKPMVVFEAAERSRTAFFAACFRSSWINACATGSSLREGEKACQTGEEGLATGCPVRLELAAMIRTFQGVTPTIPDSCFVEDTGIVIGDVVMGEDCSVWFHAVIRGDVNYIRIGRRTNVQDLCMLHVTHDTHPLIIGEEVTIGHSVVLHGCTVKDRVLVGMGSIIMDGAVIGENSVVGAGSLVTEGTIVPPRSVVHGSPAKVKRPVSDQELAWIKQSASNYIRYASQYVSGSSKARTGFHV